MLADFAMPAKAARGKGERSKRARRRKAEKARGQAVREAGTMTRRYRGQVDQPFLADEVLGLR